VGTDDGQNPDGRHGGAPSPCGEGFSAQQGRELLDAAARVLREAMASPKPPADTFADHEELHKIMADLLNVRSFIFAAANGDFNQPVTIKGYLGGALKTLQAHLRHLTWQTQRVAKGDFTQRVDYMGEFAEAFNNMVLQLQDARTRLLESEERYRALSVTDSLTGLFNRRHFFELAGKEFRRVERHSLPVAIIMLDIDHFKLVNDTRGHASGDKVLQAVAQCLRSSLRQNDIAGRYGGEEFVVLLPETDLEAAKLVAERFRSGIAEEPMAVEGGALAVTASLGVSAYVGKGSSNGSVDHLVETIVDQADQALYQAKHSGRNRVVAFP